MDLSAEPEETKEGKSYEDATFGGFELIFRQPQIDWTKDRFKN